MSFCTVINCMDGRVQLPVISYLQNRFGVKYVDTITEAGPNRIVGRQVNSVLLDSILDRVEKSVRFHNSAGLGIVAHHDCLGNPASRQNQLEDTELAVKYLIERFGEIPVVGLWVDENWVVSEVFTYTPKHPRKGDSVA